MLNRAVVPPSSARINMGALGRQLPTSYTQLLDPLATNSLRALLRFIGIVAPEPTTQVGQGSAVNHVNSRHLTDPPLGSFRKFLGRILMTATTPSSPLPQT